MTSLIREQKKINFWQKAVSDVPQERFHSYRIVHKTNQQIPMKNAVFRSSQIAFASMTKACGACHEKHREKK